jgi:hypothetical protein
VNIYRDGGIIGSGPAAGAYTDTISGRGSGTFTYKVCLTTNVNVCSNNAVVTF